MNDSLALTIMEPRQKPDPAALVSRVFCAVRNASALDVFDRMRWAHETRDAVWAGKSPDCRKRKDAKGRDPFPWAGAPDTEVRLVDTTINERVDIDMAAFERAQLTVSPRNISSEQAADTVAATWRQVMAYYLDLMEPEVTEQAARLADVCYEYGHGILRIDWRETKKLDPRTITAEAIAQRFLGQAVQQAVNAVAPDAPVNPETGEPSLTQAQMALVQQTALQQLDALFSQPSSRPVLAELAMTLDPDMPPDEASRVATALQRGVQAAEYYAVTVDESRPCWRALIPWVHVWYDPSCTTITEAPWVCEAIWLDAVALRERAAAEEWPEKFTEQVLANPGATFRAASGTETIPSWVLGTLDVGMGVREEVIDGSVTDEKLFQIVECHYRASNKAGVPCTYRTVLHGAVTDSIGLHEVCTYAHGRMPYVDLKQERKETLIAQRGLAELAIGAQLEIKLQRDARGAQVQLRANPPLQEPAGNLSGDVVIQPGERLPLRRSGITGEYRFMQIPAIAQESVEMETATIELWNEYVGRGDKLPPDVLLARRQAFVNRFLAAISGAMRQTFQLVQQYTDDVEASTIAGQPVELRVTREQIQGQFDLKLSFDVTDLNLEHTGNILKFISTLLVPLDTNGVVDRDELVRFGARKIAPELASRVVRDSQTVLQSELDDEDTAMAKLFAGIEPPFLLGKNHTARAQRIRENMGKNPELQKRYSDDEIYRALIDNRLKQHDFQVQQVQNAITGRIGGEPVLGNS